MRHARAYPFPSFTPSEEKQHRTTLRNLVLLNFLRRNRREKGRGREKMALSPFQGAHDRPPVVVGCCYYFYYGVV